MPATAAPPALSPAAEAVRRSLLELPDDERQAVVAAVAPVPATADGGEAAHVPPEVLAELKRDADEVAAGRMRTHTVAEVRAELARRRGPAGRAAA